MVNLIGMELSQAMLSLEQYQLTVAAIHYIEDEQLPYDTISDHQPEAGYPVAPGTGVQIHVNRRQHAVQSKRPSDFELFRYRIPSGFLRKAVRVRINHQASSIDLFNDYVRPSEEIWLLVPATAASTLFLYVDDELISTKHYHAQE